jgi:hypothetical protein
MSDRPVSRRRSYARLPVLALTLTLPAAPLAADEGHVDLLGLMGTLQQLVHKAQLALDAGNVPLAAFYAHELEETGEAVTAVAEYDDHPVGQLTGAMLMPAIEALDEALHDAGSAASMAAGDAALDRVINSCNACHAATEHAFIVIARNGTNTYAQQFEPR